MKYFLGLFSFGYSRRAVVSSKGKYMHEVQVNCLVKACSVFDMTIVVNWDI